MPDGPGRVPRACARHRAVAVVVAAVMVPALIATLVHATSRAQRKRAMAHFDRGAKLYKAGKYTKSAPLFLRAWSVNQKPEYLFNAARAEHRGGLLDAASGHYRQCLELTNSPKVIRDRSRRHLDELKTLREEAARKAAKKAAKKATALNKAGKAPAGGSGPGAPRIDARGPAAWRTPVGWVALGAGVLAGAVGGWLLMEHGDDQAALDQQLKALNSKGLIVGTDYETYESEQTLLRGDRRLSLAAVVSGGSLAIVGGWLLWTGSEKATVSVAPGPTFAMNVKF